MANLNSSIAMIHMFLVFSLYFSGTLLFLFFGSVFAFTFYTISCQVALDHEYVFHFTFVVLITCVLQALGFWKE